ncbi:MAG: Hsp20/alpha crystallin family protein [Kiritimatiellia bacterium]
MKTKELTKTEHEDQVANTSGRGEVSRMEETRIRPLADVYRDEHAVRILLDLPGAADQDVDVSVHDGVLAVEARTERSPEDVRIYERSFRLDRRMDTSAIEAELQRGVLALRIPFLEEARPRRIEVKSA